MGAHEKDFSKLCIKCGDYTKLGWNSKSARLRNVVQLYLNSSPLGIDRHLSRHHRLQPNLSRNHETCQLNLHLATIHRLLAPPLPTPTSLPHPEHLPPRQPPLFANFSYLPAHVSLQSAKLCKPDEHRIPLLRRRT